jgi:exonuclease SbcC
MINRITIKNFQSHKRTRIDFSEGINSLVGVSDSGKSSVIRALQWVFFNKPGGDGFRSHWGGDTEVTVHIGEDIISRIKTDSDNHYVINGKKFDVPGRNVPQPVYDILPISELNLQKQLDAPFLLSETAGARARVLNDIVDMSKMDLYIREANSRLRDKKRELGFTENQFKEFKEKLKPFSEVPSMVQVWEKMRDKLSEYHDYVHIIRKLSWELKEIEILQDQLSPYEQYLSEVLQKTKQLEKLVKEYQYAKKSIVGLEDHIWTIEQTSDNFKFVADIASVAPKIDSLSKSLELLNKFINQENEIQDGIEEITEVQSDYDRTLSVYEKVKAEHDEVFKKFRFCPICKQRVTHRHRRQHGL